MTRRVVFAPGAQRPPGGVLLGTTPEGAWLACEDDAILAGAGPLELLWSTRAGHDHAVRKLVGDQPAEAIARRRARFSARLPSRAKAELFGLQLRVLEAAARDHARDAFVRSLDLLTRLAGGARFKGLGDADLLVRLLEREQALSNELASPEGQPLTTPAERARRAQLASETVRRLDQLGRPEYQQAPIYVALVRGYLVTPPPAELLAAWRRDGTPAVPWRGGVIGPLRPDDAAALGSSAAVQLVFPGGYQAAGLRLALTEAQLAIELEDRAHDLQMAGFLAGQRVELATFRRNLASLVRDGAVAAALARQIADETDLVMAELAARPAFADPAASPAQADAEFRAAAGVLAWLVARHGLAWQPLAAELRALAEEI